MKYYLNFLYTDSRRNEAASGNKLIRQTICVVGTDRKWLEHTPMLS